jgi:hypothetical protein
MNKDQKAKHAKISADAIYEKRKRASLAKPRQNEMLMRKHTPFPWSSNERFSYHFADHNKKEGEEGKEKRASQLDAIHEGEDDEQNKFMPMNEEIIGEDEEEDEEEESDEEEEDEEEEKDQF